MPALLIAVMLILSGCTSDSTSAAVSVDTQPTITQSAVVNKTECEQRKDAEKYMSQVEAEMKAKGLDNSEEFKAFKESYWKAFNEEHKWCKICN